MLETRTSPGRRLHDGKVAGIAVSIGARIADFALAGEKTGRGPGRVVPHPRAAPG